MVACVSGINVAYHDAIGKTLDVPVCKLLGGKGVDRVSVYASGGYITDDPEFGLETQLERVADQPFRAAKIKIGLEPASDEERVRLARDILGPDRLLLVDTTRSTSRSRACAGSRRTMCIFTRSRCPARFDGYRRLRQSAHPGRHRRGALHRRRFQAADRLRRRRRAAAGHQPMRRARSGQGSCAAGAARESAYLAARLGHGG